MWVQEGGDCKEADESVSTNSWFSRFYKPKKKQTVTTIGIPMRNPKPINNAPKSVKTHKANVAESSVLEEKEKEQEPEPEPEKEVSVSPKTKSVVTAMSPALFLQNIGQSKSYTAKEDIDTKSVSFTVGDTEEPSMSSEHIDDDMDHAYDHEMDLDFSTKDNEDMPEEKELDLTIIGKKLKVFDVFPDDQRDFDILMKGTDDIQDDENKQDEVKEVEVEKNTGFDDGSNDNRFMKDIEDGLDIESWIKWDRCLEFTKNDGLLIMEIYSSMFGPSKVMQLMIEDILQKKQDKKVRFVRLNLDKLNEIKEIHEVITDYRCYTETPVPTYIFIKNGVKMDKLQGIRVYEFEQKIDQYLQREVQRPQSAQVSGTKKYHSILADRPKSAYLSASTAKYLESLDNGKENISQSGNVENIRNLIKNFNVSSQFQTTKLSRPSSAKSCGTFTGNV